MILLLVQSFRPRKTQAAPRPKKDVAVPAKKAKNSDTRTGDEKQKGGAPPNKILFLSNLPEDVTEEMIRMVFCPFPGLVVSFKFSKLPNILI